MARVSRAAAASHRHVSGDGGGTINSSFEAVDMYPSISSLRSIQAEEEREMRNYKEMMLAGLRVLFDFTIASCKCFTYCLERRKQSFQPMDNASSEEDVEITCMKERLKFHFMNPFQKWSNPKKRRFPWKLLVQIVSIILVTLQLVLFANSKFAFTSFIQQNQATFSNLFIVHPQDPDGDDPLPNPIATLYTHESLQEQVNYTIDQFFALDSVALGSYGYKWVDSNEAQNPSIVMTIRKYSESMIDPQHKLFSVSSNNITTDQLNLTGKNAINWTAIRSELSQTLSIKLEFDITTIFQGDLSSQISEAQCFQFTVSINIQNDFSSGSMPVTIAVDPETSSCNSRGKNLNSSGKLSPGVVTTYLSDKGTTALDCLVIFFAVISIIQCIRSLFSSWKLSRTVRVFFKFKFDYRLKFHQVLPLYNVWFVGVTISNILVLVGSILKFIVSYNTKASSLLLVDYTSIMIGLAVFGQWSGLLRFLSYLDKYNMLILTLRLSFPSVIRFIICTGILYIAFLLCGWLVLGPYHPKFQDPFVTSDCLFSLINGDDMFATYKGMSVASTPAYVFSKIYLYIFICLFIYVVLSVFISLISDTYEKLHEHWYERSKGLLEDFASGKLTKANYHTNYHTANHGHTHTHRHANTHTHHETNSHGDLMVDRNDEEDYEYIREASNRYMTQGRMIFNGGPELRHSATNLSRSSTPEASARLRSNTDHGQLPNFQFTVRDET